MDAGLRAFLDDHPTFGGWEDTWLGVPLSARVGLAHTLPPRAFVGSVRAVVLYGEMVLVVYGVVPMLTVGGRPEQGETLEAALIREVAEESGWLVRPLGVIGFIHVRHLDEQRPDWRRPAPDFVEPLYVCEAHAFDASRRGSTELPCDFIPVADVEVRGVPPIDRRFLDAALRLRAQRV